MVLLASTLVRQSPRPTAMVYAQRTRADKGSPSTIVYVSMPDPSYTRPLGSRKLPLDKGSSTVRSWRPLAASRQTTRLLGAWWYAANATGGAPSAGSNGTRLSTSGRGVRTGKARRPAAPVTMCSVAGAGDGQAHGQ